MDELRIGDIATIVEITSGNHYQYKVLEPREDGWLVAPYSKDGLRVAKRSRLILSAEHVVLEVKRARPPRKKM